VILKVPVRPGANAPGSPHQVELADCPQFPNFLNRVIYNSDMQPKNWPLVISIIAYWTILSISVLAFAALFLGVGMTPGNYHMDPEEILIFSLFPAGLLGCKFLIYKLRHKPGGFKILALASVIPMIQILIILTLI
jgi:hypothetical protein